MFSVSPVKAEGEPDDTVNQARAKEKPTKKKISSFASDEVGLGTRGPAFEHAEVPDNAYQDGKVADLAIESLAKLKNRKEPLLMNMV